MKTKQEREQIFREKLAKIISETGIMLVPKLEQDKSSIRAVLEYKDTYGDE